jgi:hypothetical protein
MLFKFVAHPRTKGKQISPKRSLVTVCLNFVALLRICGRRISLKETLGSECSCFVAYLHVRDLPTDLRVDDAKKGEFVELTDLIRWSEEKRGQTSLHICGIYRMV